MKPILTILIFFLSITFIGCENHNYTSSPTEITINNRTITVFVIDSCEYIGVIYGGSGDMITHKGNCKFCKQRSLKH